MASAETSVSTIEYRAAQQYVDNLTQTGRQTKANVDSSKPMSLPAWFDETRFRKAQLLFRRDGYSTLACTMVGMLSIMAVPSVVSVLVHTKQSATPQLAYRRYLSTVQHVASWVIDELKPGTRSWKSLEMVRKRHVLSSRSSEAAANGIISQADMALFQFALIGYKINNPILFIGKSISCDTIEAYTYFWRVIGHMLGIQDEYNLFVESHNENIDRLTLVQEQIFQPHLAEASDAEFRQISDDLVNGLAAFNPLLSPKSFLYFCRMANGCPGFDYWTDGGRVEHLHAMSWWDRWLLWQQMVVHRFLVRTAVTRFLLNVWMVLLYVMVMYVPVLAVWRFGWRRNYVRIMRGVKYSSAR